MSSAEVLLESERSLWRLPEVVAETFAGIVTAFALSFADVLALMTAAAGALGCSVWLDQVMHDTSWAVGVAEMRRDASEFVVVGCGLIIYALLHGHYRKRFEAVSEAGDLLVAGLFAFLLSWLAETLLHGGLRPLFLVVGWSVFPLAATFFRLTARRLLWSAGLSREKVIMVTDSGQDDGRIVSALSGQLVRYRLVKTVPFSQVMGSNDPDHLRSLLRLHGASRFVVSIDPVDAEADMVIRAVTRSRVPFSLLRPAADLPVDCEVMSLASIGCELVSYRDPATWMLRLIKSCFDVAVATILLVLLSIPMLIVAILVKLDGGPVLFGHERLGEAGRRFRCLKFRSMVVDSDRVLAAHLANNPDAAAEWAERRKLRLDPRVTRIGRFLRATSLDELPQLFNVLRLEMSLVGPRPIVAEEVARYADNIAYYYASRPGLTGLWQVSGRSDTTYEARVALDSWYARNWAVLQDLGILVRTVPAVLKRAGAR